MKQAKNPIIKIKYLTFDAIDREDYFTLESKNIKAKPASINNPPCPISPNITPNKKGNVTQVNIAGFISL